MKIQLLSFPGCPNADVAREALRHALHQVGLPPQFDDVDVSAPDTPEPLKGWGSPTILVNGSDVAGETRSINPSCRLYEGTSTENRGIPPIDVIVGAITGVRRSRAHWLRAIAVLPGAALALLPAVTCPACFAAYAGVMSAVGLGFLVNERMLAPLILVFLAIGVFGVAWSTRRHGEPGPLVLTVLGSIAVVVGRLIWSVPIVLYGGIAILLGASLWNLLAKRSVSEQLVQLRLERKGMSS